MQENLWKTGNEHGKGYLGIIKIWECEKYANNVQTWQTDESWWMMAQKQMT